MDEPTSALTASEIEQLFAAIARLLDRGVGVIYISHRMDEVDAHRPPRDRAARREEDRHLQTTEVAIDELIRLMADRELGEHFPRRRTAPGAEVLRVRGPLAAATSCTTSASRFVAARWSASAGLLGAGRTELARALVGADRSDSGTIAVKGRIAFVRSPARRHRGRARPSCPRIARRRASCSGCRCARTSPCTSARRLSRFGLIDGAAEAALAREVRGRPADQDAGARAAGGRTVRRQPAEGRAGQVARHRRRRADHGRADARHRRRRPRWRSTS